MNPLIISALGLVVIFSLAWRFGVKIGNFSIVDAVWAMSFAPASIFYAVSGEGWIWRRVAVAVVVSSWALRLGTHLTQRIAGHHPDEDRRYGILRKRYSGNGAFFFFFLAQALLVWLLMLPVYLICQNPEVGFGWLEIAGLLLWLVGICGESIADSQLKKFAAETDNKSAVCKKGLWRYSRHPNYFFQSLLWWGLFLIALPAPDGIWSILAPLAMLFFLLKVTGIPLTEKLSVEKRGDAYRRYQETTSAFVPLPPKN